MDEVFVAFNSVPDYSAGHPSLKGISDTLQGAMSLLYPEGAPFRKGLSIEETWYGPDGFGMIRKLPVIFEVQEEESVPPGR